MSVLSELALKAAKPEPKEYDIWDSKVKGFGVRVSPKGTKTFVLLYRFEGRPRRYTIARYPDLSLADARDKAQAAKGKIANGIDPQSEKKKEKRKLADRVDALVGQFIDAVREGDGFDKKWDSWKLVERSLKEYLVSQYGTRSVHHVTKADIKSALKRIVAMGHPQAANTAFWYMRAFFNWCRKEDVIAVSPCDGLDNPAPIKTRERVVSDAELAAIWKGCEPAPDEVGYPFGSIVRLLMLTGQRRTEVAAMRWSELDLDAGNWEIPGDRTKNENATMIPLSTLAIRILRGVPKIKDSPFVFPARGNKDSHFSGYAKGKKRLDDYTAIDDEPLENWTLHDLRRTLATNLGERQVPPHVIEHILNHSAASMTGVSKIYNRYAYGKEKRDALQLWADHIEKLVKQAAERDALAA
ncbi:MAG: site-specific integrase [Mesorhizobium sp.]|uniref:tyrosine-type recombinase/integrase n=1 Tax=Mesorhizobium sp. TaxID=1871066 RepID=UPI000FE9653E|nr:site-specific integrase [Mesorhizobium sp.]RWQ46998.1 MAG: site-specific integrase [Mesorhizobium sp.]